MLFAAECCFVFHAASHFALADGYSTGGDTLQKLSGVSGLVAGLLGYYAAAHYLCEDSLLPKIPMGDTSRFFRQKPKAL